MGNQSLSFGSSFGAPDMASQLANLGTPIMGSPANISIPSPTQVMPTGAMPSMADTTNSILADSGMEPGAAAQGWFGKMGGMEGMGSIFEGLGQLGQVWGALQGVKLAREQLNFSKDSYQTNLANQTQSYNTNLEDRERGRAQATGASAASVDAYLKKHSL